MNERTVTNMDEAVDETLNQEIHQMLTKPDIQVTAVSLPRSVEIVCEKWQEQFKDTADQCFARAEALQVMVDELTSRGQELDRAAIELPATMLDWVRRERDAAKRVLFLINVK